MTTEAEEATAIEAGWIALEEGRVPDARAAAKDALDEEPDAPEALLLSAACDREEGEDDRALETLRQAAAADPEWSTPELWIAEILAQDSDSVDEALKHARRALDRADEEDEFLAALALKADIELDLDRPTEARQTLRGLPPVDVPLGDAFLTLEIAQLLIEAGAADESRARLERLVAAEPQLGDAWYVLGHACEALDDEDGMRAAWMKTRELDVAADAELAAGGTEVAALSEDDLVAAAEEVLRTFPESIRRLLVDVPIVVAELPAAADVATGLDPRLLGLFHGTPHSEQGGFGETPSLTQIVLFRRNLERTADTVEALRDEVKTTLLHEAGHFFGLDEEALARLGLD